MRLKESVCVIGAGVSGLAACKNLKEHNITFICYEKGSQIGGLWRYNNDNKMSAAYRSLCMNTSKKIASYLSYPMDDNMGEFPNHEYVVQYIENYTTNYNLWNHIQLSSEITEVKQNDDKTFTVTINGKKKKEFDYLIVGQGRFWNPKIPKFKGRFTGEQMHSFNYDVPVIFTDKNVLIIGFGASGADICIDASKFAKKVFVSTKEIPFIFPKFIFGKPTDTYTLGALRKLPDFILGGLSLLACYLTQGKQKDYGFPKPNLKANKIVASSELLSRFSTGKIEIMPEVDSFENKSVTFKNGDTKEIDIIIFATGYTDIFPFFKKEILSKPHDKIFLDLYKNTIHVEYENLFFIGLIRPPGGSLIPITEIQGEWIAKIIAGKVKFPSVEFMKNENKKEAEHKKKIFKNLYNQNIDYVDYFKFPKILHKVINKFSIN